MTNLTPILVFLKQSKTRKKKKTLEKRRSILNSKAKIYVVNIMNILTF